jgi:hypothetical protein
MGTCGLYDPLPSHVRPPLQFREKGQAFEGEVNHPSEIVEMFEPVDVLDGATELVDRNGVVITVGTADPTVMKNNEYPRDRRSLFYSVHGGTGSEREGVR